MAKRHLRTPTVSRPSRIVAEKRWMPSYDARCGSARYNHSLAYKMYYRPIVSLEYFRYSCQQWGKTPRCNNSWRFFARYRFALVAQRGQHNGTKRNAVIKAPATMHNIAARPKQFPVSRCHTGFRQTFMNYCELNAQDRKGNVRRHAAEWRAKRILFLQSRVIYTIFLVRWSISSLWPNVCCSDGKLLDYNKLWTCGKLQSPLCNLPQLNILLPRNKYAPQPIIGSREPTYQSCMCKVVDSLYSA